MFTSVRCICNLHLEGRRTKVDASVGWLIEMGLTKEDPIGIEVWGRAICTPNTSSSPMMMGAYKMARDYLNKDQRVVFRDL